MSPWAFFPAVLAVAALGLLTGCGAEGPDYTLKTPPSAVVAGPIDTPVPKRVTPKARPGERRPSQRDAERLRPVLEGWAAAVRQGDTDRAARYFAVPAIVAQSMTVQIDTALARLGASDQSAADAVAVGHRVLTDTDKEW